MNKLSTKWMVLGTLAAGGLLAVGCAHNDATGTMPNNTGGSGYSNGATPTSDQQNMNSPTAVPSNAPPVDSSAIPNNTSTTTGTGNVNGAGGTPGTGPRGDNTNLNDANQGAGGSGTAGAAITPSNSDMNSAKPSDLNSDTRSTGTSAIGSDNVSGDGTVSAPSEGSSSTTTKTTKTKRHHKRALPASDNAQMNSPSDGSSITP